ncbi:lipid kinase, YegS/Rv2252/BmrU family [Azospirillum sp. RU38E]|nr:lipid kinase, YegS/Rv2252/BmrU family [Azospirillum sp. RU38E]SNT11554.1 lipid kinase, YegS/Rv2252/BmrU family [Azospirillum sp. RU37A]
MPLCPLGGWAVLKQGNVRVGDSDAIGRPLLGRVLVIFNARLAPRRRDRMVLVLDRLRRAGLEVLLQEAPGRDAVEQLAAKIGQYGALDAVIVAGGDGTLNAVFNGLPAGIDLPIGLIPLGTANVFATEIGLGSGIDAIADTLLGGLERNIHLGTGGGRVFLLMAGAGYDARVVAGANLRLKRFIGKGAYVLAGLVGLLRFRRQRYRVLLDDGEYEAASVVVCKGRHYGGRFILARDADLTSGILQVVLFPQASRRALLRDVLAVLCGRVHLLPDVRIIPSRRVVLEARDADDTDAPVQLDGDLGAQLPITLTLHPQRRRIIVPASSPLPAGSTPAAGPAVPP